MVSIVTYVEVAAPPERVWQLLMDFDRYREWHPYVELDGVVANGGELSYAIRRTPKASRLIKSEATVTQLEPVAHFALKLGLPGLTWVSDWYALEAIESGTRLTHGLEFRGLLSFIAGISRKRLTSYCRAPILGVARRFSKPAPKPTVPVKPVRKGGLRPPNVWRRRR
jgi:hypothetical protein